MLRLSRPLSKGNRSTRTNVVDRERKKDDGFFDISKVGRPTPNGFSGRRSRLEPVLDETTPPDPRHIQSWLAYCFFLFVLYTYIYCNTHFASIRKEEEEAISNLDVYFFYCRSRGAAADCGTARKMTRNRDKSAAHQSPAKPNNRCFPGQQGGARHGGG